MIEKHPFGVFVPENARYFLLGSFVTKPSEPYDWFYANGRNQFWPILERVYGRPLQTTYAQQALFSELGMVVGDIILECERVKNSNLDTNLTNLVFNTEVITAILANNDLEKFFFTSRYVENLYRRNFKDQIADYPDMELITLPSPSPRYARMRFEDKVTSYQQLLPRLV